jgi:4-hydroxybenzoyl-CoA reductase subunit beta
MLPLPLFALHRPTTLDAAVALLHELPDAMLIAGGTDLLPNMKHGLRTPKHLVALGAIAELTGVRISPTGLQLGALTTLDELATDAAVRARAPALAEAAAAVGGPHHRRMGTLGGNLCLDTRCRYYNQTAFWRGALGYCLKKDGDVCHVVQGGHGCVAAASNDTATAAIALDATLTLVGPEGSRRVAARDFYTTDGVANTVRRPDEIVVALDVPTVAGRRSAYEKLRRRGAIDFPLLSVAARADLDGDRVIALEIVVSALAARPKALKAAARAVGLARGEVPIAELTTAARRECTPLPNIEGEEDWRKEMVPVLVGRALARLGMGG